MQLPDPFRARHPAQGLLGWNQPGPKIPDNNTNILGRMATSISLFLNAGKDISFCFDPGQGCNVPIEKVVG